MLRKQSLYSSACKGDLLNRLSSKISQGQRRIFQYDGKHKLNELLCLCRKISKFCKRIRLNHKII